MCHLLNLYLRSRVDEMLCVCRPVILTQVLVLSKLLSNIVLEFILELSCGYHKKNFIEETDETINTWIGSIA